MNQLDLAKTTGISPDVIRNVECGRAPLRPDILRAVRFGTGAVWDEAKRYWLVDSHVLRYLDAKEGEPFTAEYFKRFQRWSRLWVPEEAMQQDVSAIVELVSQFDQSVPGNLWVRFLQEFHGALDSVRDRMSALVDETDDPLRGTPEAASDEQGHVIDGQVAAERQAVATTDERVRALEAQVAWLAAKLRGYSPEPEPVAPEVLERVNRQWEAATDKAVAQMQAAEAQGERAGEAQPEPEAEAEPVAAG